jgi:N-acetylneuraminate synthase
MNDIIKKPIFSIEGVLIGHDYPTYFIADIAANHDGDLSRAKDLIYLAAEKGANAAKFQHFKADTIVSDYGFSNLKNEKSHQKKWKKSVFEVYKDASVNLEWTIELKETCEKAGIAFFTSPYSNELLEHIDPYVDAHKIGSGDITWIDLVDKISRKNKPVILATGASNIQDVTRSVETVLSSNAELCLMQCNTNYTGSLENFKYIHLNVLKLYKELFPQTILGLSDHTPGHATVLGSVALGARVIEKHLTDNNHREGPDHAFSMNGDSWHQMVLRTRELEYALGGKIKKVEDNEIDSIVVQRRSIRTSKDLVNNSVLKNEDLVSLRPCPNDALPPYELSKLIGKTINRDILKGDNVKWTDIK